MLCVYTQPFFAASISPNLVSILLTPSHDLFSCQRIQGGSLKNQIIVMQRSLCTQNLTVSVNLNKWNVPRVTLLSMYRYIVNLINWVREIKNQRHLHNLRFCSWNKNKVQQMKTFICFVKFHSASCWLAELLQSSGRDH